MPTPPPEATAAVTSDGSAESAPAAPRKRSQRPAGARTAAAGVKTPARGAGVVPQGAGPSVGAEPTDPAAASASRSAAPAAPPAPSAAGSAAAAAQPAALRAPAAGPSGASSKLKRRTAEKRPAAPDAAPSAKDATASDPPDAAAPPPHRPKLKLVRDSFTMPQADFALIQLLKDRALEARRPVKKSELLRAGLHALAALDAARLKQALDALEPLKAGRPKKLG